MGLNKESQSQTILRKIRMGGRNEGATQGQRGVLERCFKGICYSSEDQVQFPQGSSKHLNYSFRVSKMLVELLQALHTPSVHTFMQAHTCQINPSFSKRRTWVGMAVHTFNLNTSGAEISR